MNRLKMPLVSVHTPRVRSSRGSCPLWPPPNGGGGRRRRVDPERAWNPELSEW